MKAVTLVRVRARARARARARVRVRVRVGHEGGHLDALRFELRLRLLRRAPRRLHLLLQLRVLARERLALFLVRALLVLERRLRKPRPRRLARQRAL
jgi:hypothetical protein